MGVATPDYLMSSQKALLASLAVFVLSLNFILTNGIDYVSHPRLVPLDDVINYGPPDASVARGIIENHLATFELKTVDWAQIQDAGHGLSQAEVARAADEAAKIAVLSDRNDITTATLLSTLAERKASTS